MRDALVMLVAAFALRCWWFGDPVVQVDEQFYLLVGDRLLHGAWPFVDIWDRKPVGLFLLYAAIRMLGGTGIVQYQVVATLFAATTALLVVRLARTMASGRAARAAGLASLIWTITFDGAGGQAPVFYNPLVAGAALIVLRTVLAGGESKRGPIFGDRIVRDGAGAMALVGIAIQIKYTVLFEGTVLGLVLLAHGRRRLPPARLAAAASLWVALALAPTLLAWAAYAAAGHGAAFVYANFLSIGDRPAIGAVKLLKRLLIIAALALPLLAAVALGRSMPASRPDGGAARRFALVWTVGALVGFLAIGSLYKHYALPLVTPLAVLAAPGLDGGRRARWRVGIVLALGLGLAAFQGVHRARGRGEVALPE